MLVGILFDTVRRSLRYRESVSCIARLDERILRDIVINRGELFAEGLDRATAH